jgi:hypothetical protein
MKELTIKFHNFTLILNVEQQFVLCMDWLGYCERYTMAKFYEIVDRVAKEKRL